MEVSDRCWCLRLPSLGSDGTVYAGSDDNYLYAIQTESMGYQPGSAWPRFGRNSTHTSRAFPLVISVDAGSDGVSVLVAVHEFPSTQE